MSKSYQDEAARYLISRGLSPVHAAGIVGNLAQESNLNPTVRGDGGSAYGLAQWRLDRRSALENFARQRGANHADPYVQLDFLVDEARGRGDLSAMGSAQTPWQAAKIFADRYERPAPQHANYANRGGTAERVYQRLASVQHGQGMLQKYSPTFAQRTADFFIPPAYGADQPYGRGVMQDSMGFDAEMQQATSGDNQESSFDADMAAVINGQSAGSNGDSFDADMEAAINGTAPQATAPQSGIPQSGMGQFAEGVKQSLWDTGTAIGQGARAILPQSTADAMELPTRADVDASAAKRSALMGTVPGAIGGIVGDIGQTLVGGAALKGVGALANMPKVAAAGNALMAPKTVGQAATVGGLLGAAQPVGTGESALANAGIGAVSGAAGYGVLKGLGAAIAPRLSPEVQMLVDEGVQPTIGGLGGRMAQATEDKLTSVPIAGDLIINQKKKALASFNRATVNKILRPVGEKLPANIETGYPAVEHTANTLGAKFDAALVGATIPIDQPFKKGLDTVLTRSAASLPQSKTQQLFSIVQTELIDRVRGGSLSGSAMKAAHTNLKNKARTFSASQDPDQQAIGKTLTDITTLVLNKAERHNPGIRPQLKSAREGYANLLRLERAAAMTGAKDGIVTGAQLASATKAMDTSVRKRATSHGKALLQDWAEAGDKVLGQKIPDSGTPGRAAMIAGNLGLAAWEPSTLALNAGLAGMYTDMMQNAMRGYVINPSAARQWSRQALEKAAPGLAGMAAAYGSTR